MIKIKENILEIQDNEFFLEISLICTDQESTLRFPSEFEILRIKSNQRKELEYNNNTFQLFIDEELEISIKTPLKALKLLNTFIGGIPPLLGDLIKLKKPKDLLVASPAIQHGKYLEYPANEGVKHLEWGKSPQYTVSVPVRLKTEGRALISQLEVTIPLPPDYYQVVSSLKVNAGKISLKNDKFSRKGVIKLKRLGGGSHGMLVPSFKVIPKGISLSSRDFGRTNDIPSSYRQKYCCSDEFWQVNHPSILKKADELKLDDIFSTTHNIMKFVRENIEVKGYSKKRLGAVETLQRKRASNTDRVDLFIALCRSVDIPCRAVRGLHFNGKPRPPEHYWVDIFTLKFGWIPVDPAFGLIGTQGVQHIVLGIEETSKPDPQFGYDWKAYGVPRINFRPERPIVSDIQ